MELSQFENAYVFNFASFFYELRLLIASMHWIGYV
jgi:hypothetical protein